MNNSRTVGRIDKCQQEQMFALMRKVRKTSAKIRAELKNCCEIVISLITRSVSIPLKKIFFHLKFVSSKIFSSKILFRPKFFYPNFFHCLIAVPKATRKICTWWKLFWRPRCRKIWTHFNYYSKREADRLL